MLQRLDTPAPFTDHEQRRLVAGARRGRARGVTWGRLATRSDMDDTRNETPLERADRNFAELLQELRVLQTGVQILFAFLLTLAFTPRFPSLDTVQRGIYVVTLLLTVSAAMLLIAPAAVHRVLFGRGVKRLIVEVSSRLAGCGMGLLALAFTGSVLLIADVVVGRAAGLAVAGGVLAGCVGLWAAMPWQLRRRAARRW